MAASSDKSFDYQLLAFPHHFGRRNCPCFLETAFCLMPNNKIVEELGGHDRFELSPDVGKCDCVRQAGVNWSGI